MMRHAFSMLTALFIIVLMSFVSLMVFSSAGRISKSTTMHYQHEQAQLLARSYTELAVYAITRHDRSSNGKCVENIDGVINGLQIGQSATGNSNQGSGFDIEVRIAYIGNNLPCSSTRILNPSTPLQGTNYGPIGGEQLSAVIIDVYVRYKDAGLVDLALSNNSNANSVPWITFHRRTIQKI